jgi:hypothetical protein
MSFSREGIDDQKTTVPLIILQESICFCDGNHMFGNERAELSAASVREVTIVIEPLRVPGHCKFRINAGQVMQPAKISGDFIDSLQHHSC